MQLFQHPAFVYSDLDLTVATDRPFGVAGLQKRLAECFDAVAKFGVINRYLHRSLLWC